MTGARASSPRRAAWPDFFLVGAQKSGTSNLHLHLSRHPDAFLPRVKEPNFFSWTWDVAPKGQAPDAAQEADYQRLFSEARPGALRGEASTSYLYHPEVPGRIASVRPDARIVACLRDPVERAYSHYLNDLAYGRERLTDFGAALDAAHQQARDGVPLQRRRRYIEAGLYGTQLARYEAAFGADRMHVFLLEEFHASPDAVLERLLSFLGLDARRMPGEDLGRATNPYAVLRNPLSRRLWQNLRLRSAANRVVPVSWRPFLRDKVLFRRVAKPPLHTTERERLRAAFLADVEGVERFLPEGALRPRDAWKMLAP